MSSEMRELYQEVILDHSKRPRNCHALEHPSCSAKGHNPLCGDRVNVFVELQDGLIKDVSFEGAGCAICTASASLMTEALKGKSVADAEALFERFHHLLTIGEEESDSATKLGKLKIFAGVREFPVRVKCATLPWHTFHAALKSQGEPVSTE